MQVPFKPHTLVRGTSVFRIGSFYEEPLGIPGNTTCVVSFDFPEVVEDDWLTIKVSDQDREVGLILRRCNGLKQKSVRSANR